MSLRILVYGGQAAVLTHFPANGGQPDIIIANAKDVFIFMQD